MELSEYRPHSKLVTKETEILQPRYPVVDAHNHLGGQFGGDWYTRPLSDLRDALDEAGVEIFVDLDGGWGKEILDRRLGKFKAGMPDRYIIFGGVDWSAWPEQGDHFGEWAAARFREQVSRGAQGLKVWKVLGLELKDPQGARVAVDDHRLNPLWQTAGELGVPVMIHIADPVAFFDPVDQNNERWEELHAHPDWQFTSPPYPPFESIMDEFANLVRSHAGTTFIGAHVGCYAENLAWVGQMLDDCPNFFVDISARIAELGRQPYTARRFFLDYADRILFGTDMGVDLDAYRIFYRFLETDDEYFNYDTGEIPGQGRWAIYGLHLPDDVLEKVYRLNARRVLGLSLK